MIYKHDDSLIIVLSSRDTFQHLESFQRQALSYPQTLFNNS